MSELTSIAEPIATHHLRLIADPERSVHGEQVAFVEQRVASIVTAKGIRAEAVLNGVLHRKLSHDPTKSSSLKLSLIGEPIQGLGTYGTCDFHFLRPHQKFWEQYSLGQIDGRNAVMVTAKIEAFLKRRGVGTSLFHLERDIVIAALHEALQHELYSEDTHFVRLVSDATQDDMAGWTSALMEQDGYEPVKGTFVGARNVFHDFLNTSTILSLGSTK